MNATELRQKLHVIINDIPEKSCWTISTDHLLKLVEEAVEEERLKHESLRRAAFDRINELEDKLARAEIDVMVAENRKRFHPAQPKREWVGLTDEDIDDLWKTEYFNLHYELPKAIEARLKEKNT